MKIEGEVKDLVKVLEMSGCEGLFDPVTFLFDDGDMLAKMFAEGQMGNMTAKFSMLDIVDEGKGKFTVNTQKLLAEVAPLTGEVEMNKEEGTLIVDDGKETVRYRLEDEKSGDGVPTDEVPLEMGEEYLHYKDIKLSAHIGTKATELATVADRKDLVGTKYVRFALEAGRLLAYIGNVDEQKYNPRKYKFDGDVISGDAEEVKLSFGISEVAGTISGEVDFHYGENAPVCMIDKGEDYRVVYTLSPLTEVPQE